MRSVLRICGTPGTLLVASLIIYGALALAPGDPATMLAGPGPPPSSSPRSVASTGSTGPSWSATGPGSPARCTAISASPCSSTRASARCSPRVSRSRWNSWPTLGDHLHPGPWPGPAALAAPPANVLVTAPAGIGIAVPTFVAALVLVEIFALRLGWFPAVGTGTGFASQLWHLTLPAFALALSWAAYVAQISRASVRDQQGREHVATARGRGLPSALVFRRHVLRNASLPIVTVSGLTVAGLIAGSIIVETAFGSPSAHCSSSRSPPRTTTWCSRSA